MLPWNYGIHLNLGTVIFLGAFYTVLVIVITTVISAVLRSRRAMRDGQTQAVRWDSDFHDLSDDERVCRHVITGDLQSRVCPNGFDCRECEVRAGFLEKKAEGDEEQPPEEMIFGMRFPTDRLYHRGHTWVHQEPNGMLTVGLDDLGKRLIGQPDSLELPEKGAKVEVNGTAWRARKGNNDVRVICPVEGTIVETGGPDSEWYLKVRPSSLDLKHLLYACEIRPWLERDMERLKVTLSLAGAPALVSESMPETDFTAASPKADWDAVYSVMFLNP
jgi:hypothetical protein